jgi:hypothetical protein
MTTADYLTVLARIAAEVEPLEPWEARFFVENMLDYPPPRLDPHQQALIRWMAQRYLGEQLPD